MSGLVQYLMQDITPSPSCRCVIFHKSAWKHGKTIVNPLPCLWLDYCARKSGVTHQHHPLRTSQLQSYTLPHAPLG